MVCMIMGQNVVQKDWFALFKFKDHELECNAENWFIFKVKVIVKLVISRSRLINQNMFVSTILFMRNC